MLKFITRTGSITSVMPRVYVSCHPDDFERHFRTICADIFAVYENCAIFYEEDPAKASDENELFMMLNEMRLFVVPVTRVLLSESSRAVNLELPFARRSNIPVLPIMTEPDDSGELTDAFNNTELFAGLQFLNRSDNDPTALRYEDKLATFLNSILVSEDEVKKIQNEFSSKIFLSYRKKDRKHAHELMRLIHRVDICRDTAIWYDEYLIPGESFDSNIKKALDESDLFVMSVTSSFEEPGNYVADYEYPDAVRKGKPLVAADMKHFDREALDNLETMYPGINVVMVDPDDKDKFGITLKQRLIEGAGIREGELLNDDGEHLYYIALAYRNGIRAEVDAVRAAEIFRLSADRGCFESYLRLIDMYRLGTGIEQDYEKALALCDKAAAALQLKVSLSMRNNNVLASVYTKRGEICQDMRDTAEALESFTAAYNVRGSMHHQFEDAPLGDFCESMITLVSSYFGLGMFEETKEIVEQFLSYTGILLKNGPDAEGTCEQDIGMLRIRARICSLMSALYIQLKLHSEAAIYARARIGALEKIEELTGEAGDLRFLADAYLGYADLLKNRDLNEASAYIDKHSEIRKRLSEFESAGSKTVSDAIDTFSIADNALLRACAGDPAAKKRAEDLYNEALDICERLMESRDRYNAIILTANVYKRFGEIEQAAGGSIGCALEHFKKALAVCREAEKEYRNDLQIMRVASGLLDRIGSVYLGTGDLSSATEYFTDALEIDMRSSRIAKDPPSKHNLAKSYMRFADVNKARGHQPVADVNNRSALKILEPLAQETDDYRILEDLALAYFRLGMSDRFKTEQKLDYCCKARATYLDLMAMTNNAAEYVNAYESVVKYISELS